MERDEEQWKEPLPSKRLAESGLSFTVGAALAMLLSMLLTVIATAAGEGATGEDWFLYLSYLVPQLAFFGAAALWFFRCKSPVKEVFAPCHPKYFILVLLLQFGLLFSLSELNEAFISLFELFGYRVSEGRLPDLEGWNLLPAILVIALLPAVFEELLFRGILTRSMRGRGWGILPTVLIAGGLFSLYHGNPEQTVYQFVCGACFSLVAIRSGSLFPTMLAHFLNNAVILSLTSFGLGDIFAALPVWGNILLIVLSAVSLVGTLVYLVFFDKRGNGRGRPEEGTRFFVAACGGIIICALEWITALVLGFLA